MGKNSREEFYKKYRNEISKLEKVKNDPLGYAPLHMREILNTKQEIIEEPSSVIVQNQANYNELTRKHNKKIFIIKLIIAVILIAGGAILGYFAFK